MCKKNCLWCQFLVFAIGNSSLTGSYSQIDEKDRKKGSDWIINELSIASPPGDILSVSRLACFKGCWDEQFLSKSNRYGSLKKIITQNRNSNNPRGNSCFYHKFEESMDLLAAKELEERETIQKESAVDRRWIKVGVWGTFLTAIATIMAGGMEGIGSILTFLKSLFK